MTLKFRRGANARDIARVHEKLGMAAKLLRQAMDLCDEHHRCALNTPSQDALHRMAERIRLSMYGLEEPFVRAAGMGTPFANTDNPAAWIEWLDQQSAADNPSQDSAA